MDSPFLLPLAAAAFGAILGSFLNALLYRYRTGRSILWAHSTGLRASRSQCMRCSATLEAPDLIPIFSYLFLMGKCRRCGVRISLQYPLVEFAALLLSLSLYWQYGFSVMYFISLTTWLTLLFILVYDLRHSIIPWSATGLLAFLALLTLVLTNAELSTWIAGPLLALPLFLLSLTSRGRWMGWGDAPLELSLGWLLGLWGGLTAFTLAFWSGALVGIVLMALSARYTMKSEIPFAPFLIFGAWCVYFLHVDLFSSIPTLFF